MEYHSYGEKEFGIAGLRPSGKMRNAKSDNSGRDEDDVFACYHCALSGDVHYCEDILRTASFYECLKTLDIGCSARPRLCYPGVNYPDPDQFYT